MEDYWKVSPVSSVSFVKDGWGFSNNPIFHLKKKKKLTSLRSFKTEDYICRSRVVLGYETPQVPSSSREECWWWEVGLAFPSLLPQESFSHHPVLKYMKKQRGLINLLWAAELRRVQTLRFPSAASLRTIWTVQLHTVPNAGWAWLCLGAPPHHPQTPLATSL